MQGGDRGRNDMSRARTTSQSNCIRFAQAGETLRLGRGRRNGLDFSLRPCALDALEPERSVLSFWRHPASHRVHASLAHSDPLTMLNILLFFVTLFVLGQT
jgi:hypothetical protein